MNSINLNLLSYLLIAISIIAAILTIIKSIKPTFIIGMSISKLIFLFLASSSVLVFYKSKNNSKITFSISSDSPIEKMTYERIADLELNTIDIKAKQIEIETYKQNFSKAIDQFLNKKNSNYSALDSQIVIIKEILKSPTEYTISELKSAISKLSNLGTENAEKLLNNLPNKPVFAKLTSISDTYTDEDTNLEYYGEYLETYDKVRNLGLETNIESYTTIQELTKKRNSLESLNDDISRYFSHEYLSDLAESLSHHFEEILQENVHRLQYSLNTAQSMQNELLALKEDAERINQSQKDNLLISVIVPIFAILLIAILFIPWIYRDKDTIISALFQEKLLLQSFTVFILVITIILLALGDKITEESLGTLLGGISVYVLQQTLGAANKKESENAIAKIYEKQIADQELRINNK